jgi:hypothetical protein
MDAPAWSTEIARGLARVHFVLRRSLDTIVRVFPRVKAAAERASVDGPAASVAGWRADHEKLLTRLAALKTAVAQYRGGGLMKRIWARDFQPCLKFAHNPSFAL